MVSVTVRPARHADAAAIAEIYNQGIRGRGATFETEERTVEERERWLASHGPAHPCLVAIHTGVGESRECVVGWASTSPYSARPCYRGVAHFSVYVHEAWRGHRIGVILLEALIAAAEATGLWKLESRIFPENAASRAACARLGFREVGYYEKHAQLDGVWKDCVIVERLIPANMPGADLLP